MGPAGSMRLRRVWLRAQMLPGSLLTAEELAYILPGRPADNRTWIESTLSASARELAGSVVYAWGDVLEATEARTAEATRTWLSTEEAAKRLNVSRTTLDQMLAKSPADLPGAPLTVGGGGRRRHLRWPADKLLTFMEAYRAWEREEHERRSRPAPTARPARRARQPEPEGGPVDWKAVARG